MKVVLLGYMGVGKSTLGKLLSNKLKLKYLDLDLYIENKEKLSIPELFKTKGEIYFRKVEAQALKEIISNEDNFVLSLGGGTPVYGDNMKTVVEAKDVTSIYLKLQLNSLMDRLFLERHTRPLISHFEDKANFEDFVRKHLFERQQFYFLADHVLDVTGANPSDSLQEVVKLLNLST